MIKLSIHDETSPLETVVLGTAEKMGDIPDVKEAYDPKSIEHIQAGTYPVEKDMIAEMEAFRSVFERYGVEVLRPEILPDCNQIFTRDIAFVVDDFLINSNILPNREAELKAIDYILRQVAPDKVIHPPAEVHVEGGDVMLWKDWVFVGTYKGNDYSDYITARTNPPAVSFLKELFPQKQVKDFDLVKSNTDARRNALHLDCCFQPVGKEMAIIHREGFRDERDYQFLLKLFGAKNLFHIDRDEMYHMNSNIFSISDNVVVSERNFTRLNNWLRSHGFVVEEIPYAEIAKQEGLLRCSTLPLRRRYEEG